MGQAVNVAVGRFVAVGEAIAAENQELKDEMGQACFEARRAGKPPETHTHTHITGLFFCVCRQHKAWRHVKAHVKRLDFS